MTNPLVEIRNLNIKYGNRFALENANMIIREHDFIGMIGPNGGGKTTLLKAILGLIEPTSGTVHFSDQLKSRGSDIGYLPQVNTFDQKFPITVFEVVLSGTANQSTWFGRNSSENRERAAAVIKDLKLGDIVHKSIGELSGGQMQRVFLARALVSNPKLLILDEPDTYVDNLFESELYEKLKEVNKQMAILLVSHDVGTISTYVKSIACVNRELHYHPSNKITPDQLASYNCPIQIITHGEVPHTVLGIHQHEHP